MIKGIKKVIRVVILTLIVIVTVYNAYNLINTKIFKNDITVVNKKAILEVVSGSMEPTIKIGDLIVIDLEDRGYIIGDIVTYYDEVHTFVTHRIIDVREGKFITKGDFNNAEDRPLDRSNIVGKYMFSIPYIGNIINLIRNKFTLIVILILGSIICVLLSVDDKSKKEVIENKKKSTEKVVKKEVAKPVVNKTTKKVTIKKEEVKPVKKVVKKTANKTESKPVKKVIKKKSNK